MSLTWKWKHRHENKNGMSVDCFPMFSLNVFLLYGRSESDRRHHFIDNYKQIPDGWDSLHLRR